MEVEIVNHVVLGIMAHADAGKTTLTEAILYKTGAIRCFGRVDHKNCFLDDDEMERNRGITIFSKQAQFELEGKADMAGYRHCCTLIDTPGHMDFTPEMERAMSIMDAAVLVISGTDGVQGHTENIWRLAERYRIPVVLFLNKMDRDTAGKEILLQQMKKRLSESVTDFMSVDISGKQISLPEEVLEEIAVCDEELMEHFLEEDYMMEDWEKAIRKVFQERKLFPCFMGSALQQEGVETFLKGLSWLLPCHRDDIEMPVQSASNHVWDSAAGHVWDSAAGNQDGRKAFSGRVYKILHDAQGERLTFFKVTGG